MTIEARLVCGPFYPGILSRAGLMAARAVVACLRGL